MGEKEGKIPPDIFWSNRCVRSVPPEGWVQLTTSCFIQHGITKHLASTRLQGRQKETLVPLPSKYRLGYKKVLSTLDIRWELQILIILESRENAARRAQLLFYARALHLWRAFVTRFSAVFRAALTEIVRFSRPLSGENVLYCTLNALWVLCRGVLAGCAVVLTINHSTTRAAGPVTQLRGREVTVSSLPHTSIYEFIMFLCNRYD